MKSNLFRLGVFVVSFLIMGVMGPSCSKKKGADDSVTGGVEGGGFEDPTGNGEALPGMGAGNANLAPVFFGYDNYSLSSSARSTLQANVAWLKENPTVIVQVEGHCDERGSIEYNLALGEKRANAVKSYLQQLGIDSSRLSVISYGEERPLDPGSNDAAWAKNRRGEFVVLSQ